MANTEVTTLSERLDSRKKNLVEGVATAKKLEEEIAKFQTTIEEYVVIFVKTSAGTIKLEPGDRKEVAEENAEVETPILPGGDLYPAGSQLIGLWR